MTRKTKQTSETDPVLNELDAIKRLLMLTLIKAGTKQDEIAMALQVDRSLVSRMFPTRKVARFTNGE